MKISLTVNGLQVDAQYSEAEIQQVHLPLLQHIAELHRRSGKRRTVVFLSAPPGTGKSTLTTFWANLSQREPGLPAMQTLPMDGFHHYNAWLDANQLRPFKGAPETFDVAKLANNLRQLGEETVDWPQYDRQKHDPVEAAIAVTASIVIVEGNWLLLDDDNWKALGACCDLSVFITAPASALRERLVQRKIAGGLSQEEAQAFYLRTDGPNVARVLGQSRQADVVLCMTETGEYRVGRME